MHAGQSHDVGGIDACAIEPDDNRIARCKTLADQLIASAHDIKKRSAIGMQRELGVQDVPVRIGIHLGEVIVEPTGLVGDAVNIASRIESFAVPGSVMVSDSVHDLVRNRPDATASRCSCSWVR